MSPSSHFLICNSFSTPKRRSRNRKVGQWIGPPHIVIESRIIYAIKFRSEHALRTNRSRSSNHKVEAERICLDLPIELCKMQRDSLMPNHISTRRQSRCWGSFRISKRSIVSRNTDRKSSTYESEPYNSHPHQSTHQPPTSH
jgi:hypothetical protein